MIGKCPHCGIDLTIPNTNNTSNRITNEVILVMTYRSRLDSNQPPKPIKETGSCEICNATLEDLKEMIDNS